MDGVCKCEGTFFSARQAKQCRRRRRSEFVWPSVFDLSQREVTKGCRNIIEMSDGQTTVIANPNDPSDRKSFTFDHSYWSFDGFEADEAGRFMPDVKHPRGSEYCDQKRLFEDLGSGVVSDALDGYNATLFSYGQTGSGKSFSIMGYGPNEGILPQFCNRLFQNIEERTLNSTKYEIHLSMLEIYNELVYDLLHPVKNVKGLKVREHPKKGFFAEGLKSFSVSNYGEVQRLIEQGTLNRTVVSTNMNATSSRAHTIVSLVVIQKKTAGDVEETTTATVNIVDLAGSERARKAGNASGERFREGVAINQSLQCLSHCIHALAESSSSSGDSTATGRKTRIPYRDSVLTKLLMNALGGNSKTIMIASISPADSNYDETLSTLRYADRAKQIRTRAFVNKDPTEKIVRELKTENQRLKAVLARGNIDPQWLKTRLKSQTTNPQVVKEAKKKWEEELRAQMSENERELNDIREHDVVQTADQPVETQIEAQPSRKTGPYLENINIDPLLNGRWIHVLKDGRTLIGKRGAGENFIEMIGPGMQENHAEIEVNPKMVTLRPLSSNGRVLVNGVLVARDSTAHLQPNDRLVFGATQLWLFRHPELEREAGVSDSPMINYDFFLNEMASKSGLDVLSTVSEERASLQEELVALLPMVDEANGISAELDKPTKFEIILISPQTMLSNGEKTLPSQVYVKMRNLANGYDYLWSKDKFLNRFDLMRELYRRQLQKYYGEDDEVADELQLTIDTDPFLEAPDAIVIIGVAKIFLQPLGFLMEIKDSIPVTDLQGSIVGMLDVTIVPCADRTGRPYKELPKIGYPKQLIGRNVYFDFHIISCRALPPKFKDLHCKYGFYGEKTDTTTGVQPYSSNIMFQHNRIVCYEPATREFVSYLSHGSLVIEVLGRHAPLDRYSAESDGSMRQMFLSQRFSSSSSFLGNESQVTNLVLTGSEQEEEISSDYHLVREDHKRLKERLDGIRELTDRCLYVGQETIPTALLDAMLNANTQGRPLAVHPANAPDDDHLEWRDYEIRSQTNERSRSSVCSIS